MKVKYGKIVSLVVVLMLLLASLPAYAGDMAVSGVVAPELIVSHAEGKPSTTVELSVQIKNNPGISNYGLVVQYDSARLEYISAAAGAVLGQNFSDQNRAGLSESQVRIRDYTSDGDTVHTDGVLFTLTFRIVPEAKAGLIAGDDLIFAYPSTMFDGFTRIEDVIAIDIQQGSITVLEDNSPTDTEQHAVGTGQQDETTPIGTGSSNPTGTSGGTTGSSGSTEQKQGTTGDNSQTENPSPNDTSTPADTTTDASGLGDQTQSEAANDEEDATADDSDFVPEEEDMPSEAIVLTIDSTVVTQGEVVLEAPAVAPQIMGGRTMLPFRYLIQTILGGTVHWDDVTCTITAEVNGTSFQMTIDDNTIIIDGESITFDQAPVIVDDYTLVPLRVFEKAVQYIAWDEVTRTVTIYP